MGRVSSAARVRPPKVAELRRSLARWFDRSQRTLPWRRTRDPYAIWISESMLQQTRVEAVLPHYRRFLERFPDLASLAAAHEDEVLAVWSGLGYYSRARALLQAARIVRDEHGGRFPRTRAEWLALPGVGPYTAGAMLSIAFGLPEPLVDGNVQRVFARLFALEDPVGSAALRESCWELARALVPGAARARASRGGASDPGQWNQALMELGARVCTSRAPRCEPCPVRGSCRAALTGRTAGLPRARARQETLEVALEVFVVRRGARVLVQRRPAGERMAGLWELPTREVAADGESPRLWPRELGLEVRERVELGRVRHTITRHRITARVLEGCCTRALPVHGGRRWVETGELDGLGLTGLARKALVLARQRSRAARPRGRHT